MEDSKAHIIDQLRKEILSLQGLGPTTATDGLNIGFGPIAQAFPNHTFPLHAVHEFLANTAEDKAATYGFMAGILTALMRRRGVVLWIGDSLQMFPHAFHAFGIDPAKIIFISLDKEKDVLWAVEEALKCTGLSAVVGELYTVNFDISRRLQLAVEKSHVTGFLINRNTKNISSTACVTRWRINALPSQVHDEMPGVGFPRWKVELLKVRNGRTGSWKVEWLNSAFHISSKTATLRLEEHRKTG